MKSNHSSKSFPVKLKCKDCDSEDIKKRKNFSHGKGSKSKTSYSCNNCNSSNVEKITSRRPFRK